MDLGYKIVKKDHSYDLSKLKLTQLEDNIAVIRKAKNTSCKFGALLVCTFYYVQDSFPTIETLL